MTRYEILNALRSYAHTEWYGSLLNWETPQLTALLAYYRAGGKYPTGMVGPIYRTKGMDSERRERAIMLIEIGHVPKKPRRLFDII